MKNFRLTVTYLTGRNLYRLVKAHDLRDACGKAADLSQLVDPDLVRSVKVEEIRDCAFPAHVEAWLAAQEKGPAARALDHVFAQHRQPCTT